MLCLKFYEVSTPSFYPKIVLMKVPFELGGCNYVTGGLSSEKKPICSN